MGLSLDGDGAIRYGQERLAYCRDCGRLMEERKLSRRGLCPECQARRLRRGADRRWGKDPEDGPGGCPHITC